MRKEKSLLLDELKEKIEKSNSLIVARYENITPTEAWDFRDNLTKIDSELEVVKKRILFKALQMCGYEIDIKELIGHIAVVLIQKDAIAATKVVCNFEKETEKLKIISAKIEGKKYTKNEVEQLSNLPSLEVLRAQFLGLLEAPMSETLGVMDSMLTSIIYAIDEKKKLEENK